jgi:hypothetical protein
MLYYTNCNNDVISFDDGVSAEYIKSDFKKITEADAMLMLKEKYIQNELTYFQNRILAYKSIGEQLDMIYHDHVNGTSTWSESITEIKDRYPKDQIIDSSGIYTSS